MSKFWSSSNRHLRRYARKPTVWIMRKVSTRNSLSLPRRLTRADTFRLLWIFCFRNHYSILLSPWDGMRRPGLACADCAGWSGSIHSAETTILGFLAERLIYHTVIKFMRNGVTYLNGRNIEKLARIQIIMITIHGHEPCLATVPPTILLVTGWTSGTPHGGGSVWRKANG